jgi:positive regulator of sigma E activity
MLPNLPLDVNGKQIREGDKVVFGADNGSYLYSGEVVKITPCFAWMKIPMVSHKLWRREFRRVAIIGDVK